MTRRYASISRSKTAGSTPSGEPEYLAVGKLRRPHGVRGEIILEIMTDFPERLRLGSRLYIGEAHQEVRLRSVRPNGNTLLLSFEGYPTPETVGIFRNQFVFVTAGDRPPLPEGEYYHHQLVGLQVVSDKGELLGQVSEILETGANDVLVVRPPSGPEILLPAIDSVILQVDLAQNKLQVHLLPGLVSQIDTERDDEPDSSPEATAEG